MRQNGRKSAAAVAVLPHKLERKERLEPPDSLGIKETLVWVAVVNGHPADWFDAGAVPVLVQLCRHVVVADRIAEMIERTGNNGILLGLLNTQRSESEIIRKLATALRVTPQSLLNHNGNKKPQSAVVVSPWSRAADAG